MDKWFHRYMDLAAHVAQWSKDPTTKVGAVIVGADRKFIALGFNGFPPKIADLEDRMKHRPTKYIFTQHAERNVLDNASFSCVGATIVTTMFPCIECAKSIIAKGIVTVIAPEPPPPISEPSWRDQVKWSLAMLKEAGVVIHYLDPTEKHPS